MSIESWAREELELGELQKVALASQICSSRIQGLGDDMFASKLWYAEGDGMGRFALAGRGDVREKIEYAVAIKESGLVSVPGAGLKRVTRYVGPKDRRVRTAVVHFPGFAHTHRYEDPRWYIEMLAELAAQYRAAFITINQTGNAVRGADLADGRGRISARDRRRDNHEVLTETLVTHLKPYGRDDTKLVVSGHSLGGRDALNAAYDVLQEAAYPAVLSGVAQWAPLGIGTWEDLMTKRYVAATMPHLWPSLKSVMGGKLGLDFTLDDVSHLFYNGEGGVEQARRGAIGMYLGSAMQFFDNTLRMGNAREARMVAKYLSKRGKHIHLVRSQYDNIFGRSERDEMVMLPNVVKAVAMGPHNILHPGTSYATRKLIRNTWMKILEAA